MDNIMLCNAEKIASIELYGSGYCFKYIQAILRAQKCFFEWLIQQNISDLSQVTKKNLGDYQTYLLHIVSKQTGKPLARGTLSDKYNAVKMLFSALYRSGVLRENIASTIKFELPKREGLKRQAFSNKTMSAILEKMDIDTKIGLRDRALFELIYSTGLRVSEAVTLYIKDLNLYNREMIVRGKFARDRIVPISKVAHYYLLLYLNDRIHLKDEPVFRSVYKTKTCRALKPGSVGRRFSDLLKTYGEKTKELSAHSIRHSNASHLLQNGAGIRYVQELLGHKNLETTAHYTHVPNEKLFKIYKKYHPFEHDLYTRVDGAYKRRLSQALGIEVPK